MDHLAPTAAHSTANGSSCMARCSEFSTSWIGRYKSSEQILAGKLRRTRNTKQRRSLGPRKSTRRSSGGRTEQACSNWSGRSECSWIADFAVCSRRLSPEKWSHFSTAIASDTANSANSVLAVNRRDARNALPRDLDISPSRRISEAPYRSFARVPYYYAGVDPRNHPKIE